MNRKLETGLYASMTMLIVPVVYTVVHEFGHFSMAKILGFEVTGFELNYQKCNGFAVACVKSQHNRTVSLQATDRAEVAVLSAGSLLNAIVGASMLPLLSHGNLKPLFWLEFTTAISLLLDFPVYLLGDLVSSSDATGDWRKIIEETHLSASYFALLATSFLMTFLPLEFWRIRKGFQKYYGVTSAVGIENV